MGDCMTAWTKIGAALLMAGAIGMTLPALAQTADEVSVKVEAEFGSATQLSDAFTALAQSITDGDKETAAALMWYPLHVTSGGKRFDIKSPESFIERYDEIVTEAVKLAVTQQDFAALTIGEDFVSTDGDVVSFKQVCAGKKCQVKYWLVRAIDVDAAAAR
jgi:hypothetical protein